jgi:nicotinate dehydrogenase subunit B
MSAASGIAPDLSRRGFLKAGGALIVAFSWPATFAAETLPRRGPATPDAGVPSGEELDSWLAIDGDGLVTLYSGKVELGTGVQTALAQIVAEELDVAVARVHVVMGETGRVPNQGPTVGSKTIQNGGPQIRRAAAEARKALEELASAHFTRTAGTQTMPGSGARLSVTNGVVSLVSATGGDASAASPHVSYAELIGGKRFERRVANDVMLKRPSDYHVVGQPVPRIELPAKVFGTHEYVHNVRVPGMLHGRVIRPSPREATVESIDEASVRALPGFVAVVHRGSFVGVVAEREEQAIAIAAKLAPAVKWSAPAAPLPDIADLEKTLRATPGADRVIVNTGSIDSAFDAAKTTLTATYSMPFQSHGSIGPSCGVADVKDGGATIWSGTQGSYQLRGAIADLIGVPAERVRVMWTEASGCYGHNGADDAAADAALLSQAVGKPVRVQWSRQDELGWDPKGPAMLMDVRGALDAQGQVVAWDYKVSTTTHSTRPGGNASNLLAAQLARQQPPKFGQGGGDRNARHSYDVPNNRVAVRWLEQSVVRPSAFRGLGAPANVFAIESFVDELAAAARADPVEFRLRSLKDPRATAVVQKVAELAQWQAKPRARASAVKTRPDVAIGRGVAYLQYENENTYVATVAHVTVHRRSGAIRVARVFVAHDCGLIINPDGLRNQIEGGTIQTISRTLKEQVQWDQHGVTTVDWASYPILTFAEVPDSIQIALIDRPDQPALGAGEAAACAVPAAIANAVFDAVGVRLRHIPFTPERVKAALG